MSVPTTQPQTRNMFQLCWERYQATPESDAEQREWWLGGMLADLGRFYCFGRNEGTCNRLADEIFERYKDKAPQWLSSVVLDNQEDTQ